MIITIDGPAGSGKSTAAKGLARRLGFIHLDTGALYRAVAFQAISNGAELDEAGLAALAEGMEIDARPEPDRTRVFLGGVDVTDRLRDPAVTRVVSRVAASRAIRERLNALQRQMAAGLDLVVEGRDMGTVVFPDANAKFYLDAAPEARARRRTIEMATRGVATDETQVLGEILARDRADSTRALAPLAKAPGAMVVDTTDLAPESVVEVMMRAIAGLK